MELDAHQMSLEPFGAYGPYTRRQQDMELASRARHLQPAVSASAPPPPPSRHTPPRETPKHAEGCVKGLGDGGGPDGAGSDVRWGSKPPPRSHDPTPRPKASEHESQHAKAVAALADEGPEGEEREERAVAVPKPAPFLTTTPLAFRPRAKRGRTPDDVDGPGTAELSCKKRRLLLRLVTSRLSRPFSLPATHILIRESGDNMPVLHRIQQLASLGARRAGHQGALVRKAAILNRVRIGVRQAAVSRGHTAMADLAARCNALGHGLLLVTAAPQSSGPTGALFPPAGTHHATGGAVVPAPSGNGAGPIPPVWRPHTTSFHPPIAHGYHHHHHHPHLPHHHPPQHPHQHQHQHQHQHGQQTFHSYGVNVKDGLDARHASTDQVGGSGGVHTHAAAAAYVPAGPPHRHKETVAEPVRPGPAIAMPSTHNPGATAAAAVDASDEEDNTAFPAASFHDRYADLSDDDMDDVYADFGVLFGSGVRSPEARAVGSPVEEQFYEEYLDELDGIPWVV